MASISYQCGGYHYNVTECGRTKSFFLFVSTDFVFDGETGTYTEADIPNPVNFYGKTKAEAEDAVKEYDYEWAIVRTSLVYGQPIGGRSNLLTVVQQKLNNGEKYKVVNDLVRTPTYVEDLAAGIVSIIEKRQPVSIIYPEWTY